MYSASDLKKGLKMTVDNGGTNLSEGEKQLVCFARAVINPKQLVILDEATASIDYKTEEMIHESVLQDFLGSAMLIIAHRIQTVMQCNRILVLKDGEIQDFDSPGVLMQRNSFFKGIIAELNK